MLGKGEMSKRDLELGYEISVAQVYKKEQEKREENKQSLVDPTVLELQPVVYSICNPCFCLLNW